VYDEDFFDYVDIGAKRSAGVIVRLAYQALRPGSVLDVGCGRGVWLAEWMRCGTRDVCGVDGSYLRSDRLVIPQDRFTAHDLSRPFGLGRRFDLVQCLEVAEHIEASAADRLIESLTRHGDVILFSAAVPGQGGVHHVNEQPPEYWREKFACRGYTVYDPWRSKLRYDRRVEMWYRYNLLVYASLAGEASLPNHIRESRIAVDVPIPDLAPAWRRARNHLLRRLPRHVVTGLARLKERLVRSAKRPR
jgi:SAM-dependent methyltransferase